jgi:hypothetical protein
MLKKNIKKVKSVLIEQTLGYSELTFLINNQIINNQRVN